MNNMKDWLGKPYYSLNAFLHQRFGEKLYKVSLDEGMTCPNRDGTLGSRGCIFCSAGGSGDFAGDRSLSITDQIEEQICTIRSKRPVDHFIAYFQAYTNTYAPLSHLRRIYMEAAGHPAISAISIGTRPDCLAPEVLELLSEVNRIKPIWVELGLQTIHDETAHYIRRGYDLPCFIQAVSNLQALDLDIIVHLILGLPGETEKDIQESIKFMNTLPITGIKLQLLHVLEDTDLADEYRQGKFHTLTQQQYVDLIITCLEHLRPDIVIHRLTGDGPKNMLIAPKWSSAKRSVLNDLHHQMSVRGIRQGDNIVREGVLYD